PKAEYSKEFFPDEVAMLLATGGVVKPVERDIEQETQLLLGQPTEYPAAMIDALTTLFSQRKLVRRAFLALIHDREVDEQPNLLIGLDVKGEQADIDALISEAGMVASETAPNDDPVDFCLVEENARGVSHYLVNHTQPFYQRRWGSWLRNAIPSTDVSSSV
ncbi:MAG: enhanced serine sensitivity protein SseB C-terminal domain-containing protein, partial [Plesiomonas sp.]